MSLDVIVDIREKFGAVRDQGERPTCLAFSISDTHAAMLDPWEPLSVEYIFYHAQKRSGSRIDEGSTVDSVLEALESEGQPIESDWPYTKVTPDSWILPASDLETFHRTGSHEPTEFEKIVSILDTGHPIVLLICLSKCFFVVAREAIIEEDTQDPPDPALRHAVVAVGHGKTEHGERVVTL